ncbi:MAG: hypothetical protein FJ126_10710 [Deltaproteobacteria bacterium]|nr:hypothetical protein [Deltaproteobacteria bacterium]
MSRCGYRSRWVFLGVLTIASLFCPSSAPGAGWESRGIGGGGGLFCPAISPHDHNLVYMSTDMSAVFKSGDFGRNWTTLDFRQLQGGTKSYLGFTSAPNILYANNKDASGDVNIPSRSVDGGQTWTPITDPTLGEIYYMFVDPTTTSRLMIGSYRDLYFSNDSGASFSLAYHLTPTPTMDGLNVGGVFWDGNNIYVGTSAGLLVSDNGGTSFTVSPLTGIPNDEYLFSFAGAKQDGSVRFFALTAISVWPDISPSDLHWFYRGVYRLDWGQAGWVKKVGGLTDCPRPTNVAMAMNNINVAYLAGGNVCTNFPMVYKTTNGGDAWTDVFLTTNNENIFTGWSGNGGDRDWWYGEFVLGFTVCANNANRVMFTDLGFAHVTENGGASWRAAYVKEESLNPTGLPTPKGKNYVTNGVEDTSVWRLEWFNPDIIFASFTDIHGIRTADKGQSWVNGTALGLPHNTTYYSMKHPVSGKCYAATSSVHDMYQSTFLADARIDGGQGLVLVSDNNGEVWETLHDFGHPVIWLALHPTQPDTMYASVIHSTLGGIYVTHNLSAGTGATWTRLGIPPRTEGHPFNIHCLKDGTLVASYSGRRNASGAFTLSSGIFVSTDGGATWLDRSHTDMRRWTKDVVIDPHDPSQNTWYAAVFSHWGAYPNEVGGLFRTTNRGQNWTRLNNIYRVESVTIHPKDPETMYLTTEVEGLWITRNLSAATPTFTQLADYPFRHPVRVFFNPYDVGEIWTTSFGGGLHVKKVGGGGKSDAANFLLLSD